MNSNTSSRIKRAIIPKTAPKDREPTSPMNTCAGYELNHKNPKPAPTIAVHAMVISAALGTYGI